MPITDAPINRQAGGFLGFVDVKAMGKNPQRVADFVQPIVDMRPFYAAMGRTSLAGNVNIAGGALGLFVSPITLPADRPTGIYLEGMDCTGPNLLAGETLQFQLMFRVPGGGVVTGITGGFSPPSPAFVGLDQGRYEWCRESPIILPPGSTFGVLVTRNTVAALFNYGVTIYGTLLDW